MGNKFMLSGGLRTKGTTKQSQENQPLITVVTVVRNGEKTLEETILSVINQTYKNVEYIIVDGASTDGTLDIIKKYENRIDYWISEPDKGIYDAMNKGIDLAIGDYIALLNSDDWYELNACEIIAEKINEINADIYFGMVRVIDKQSNECINISGYNIYLINQNMIAHQTCFISKEIYLKYKYDIKYKSASDYDFMIRVYKSNASFYFIEKIITNARTGGISWGIINEIETMKIRRKYRFIKICGYYVWKLFFIIRYIYIKILKG
jgi:glycosyltransferase involved in cell wall biosynthesis